MQHSLPKIIGINGLHMKPFGFSNIDRLLQQIRRDDPNLPIWDYKYQYTGVISRYFELSIKTNAKRLVEDNKERLGVDIAVAHSAGTLILNKACQMGARYRVIVLMGGSLNENTPWEEDWAELIINIYNPTDWVLYVSSLIPWHPFGKLGYTGYTGPHNPNLFQINADEVHQKKSWFHPHYDYFRIKENVELWSKFVIDIYRCQLRLDKFLEKYKKLLDK